MIGKKIALKAGKWAAKKGAKNVQEKALRAVARARAVLEKFAKENPNYDHAGASFDLFGGESRRLPKKVSEFHRPRVRVRGGTLTLADGSPFKGRVAKINPGAKIVTSPLRVTLERAEVEDFLLGGRWPSDSLVEKILIQARKHTGNTGWDHIEAMDAKGRHLFDLIP